MLPSGDPGVRFAHPGRPPCTADEKAPAECRPQRSLADARPPRASRAGRPARWSEAPRAKRVEATRAGRMGRRTTLHFTRRFRRPPLAARAAASLDSMRSMSGRVSAAAATRGRSTPASLRSRVPLSLLGPLRRVHPFGLEHGLARRRGQKRHQLSRRAARCRASCNRGAVGGDLLKRSG